MRNASSADSGVGRILRHIPARAVALLTLALLAAGAAAIPSMDAFTQPSSQPVATRQAASGPSLSMVHEVADRLLYVTGLVISPDGRYLVASYHSQPWRRPDSDVLGEFLDRPRTDWSAWTAIWDLTTGRRTIAPDATYVLAVSPDGQWLVMGRSTPEKKTEFGVVTNPWLWKTAQVQPVCKLTYTAASASQPATRTASAGPTSRAATSPPQGDKVVARTFSGDGKEVLGVTADYCLVSWPVGGDGKGNRIVGPGPTDDEPPVLRAYKDMGWVNLRCWGNKLTMMAEIEPYPWSGAPEKLKDVNAVYMVWTKGDKGWTRERFDYFKRYPAPVPYSRYTMYNSNRSYELLLPYQLLRPLAEWPEPLESARWPETFVFAPKGRLVAFMEPWSGGLATVRKVEGERLWQFPAADVHAFTPDGKQLITSERNGVLRFWDVATGKIVRSLRLDDKPADTVRVAAIQLASEFGNPDANRAALGSQIELAALGGAQIIVLPEAAITGYSDYKLKKVWQVGGRELSQEGLEGVDPKDVAETVPGPSTRDFAKYARKLGIYLTAPLVEVDRKTGRYYNTIVLVGPSGQTLIHYRKVNPWPWAEKGWATEGNLGHPIADTPYGRLSVLVCFDIHKQAKELADIKVDTLLYSIAWVDEKDSDWFSKRLPDIARANGLNIVGANWTLPVKSAAPSWFGYGHSTIIDAKGNILVKVKNDIGNEIIFADIPIPTDAGETKADK